MKKNIIILLLLMIGITGCSDLKNPDQQKISAKDFLPKNDNTKIFLGRLGDNITDQSVSHSRIINFAFQVGKEYADLEFCNKLINLGHNFQSACYAGVAVVENDNSICKKAPPQDGITECYSILAYLNKDTSLCGEVWFGHQDSCLLRAGYGIKNYDICETTKLSNRPSWQEELFSSIDSCKMGVGMAMEDSTVCEKINETRRVECYIKIAKESKSYDICNKFENDTQSNCILAVAEYKQDYDTCKNISSNNCFVGILGRNPDLKVCEVYKDSFSGSICYRTIALAQKDVTICDKIKDLEEHKNSDVGPFIDRCIESVAHSSGDIELCEKIETTKFKERCLKRTNGAIIKLRLCEIIKNKDLKNECMKVAMEEN